MHRIIGPTNERLVRVAIKLAMCGPVQKLIQGAVTVGDRILKAKLLYCGEEVRIHRPVSFQCPGGISLGDYVSIAAFVHIWGNGGVRVGRRTMIGSHVAITSITHDYRDPEMWRTQVLKPVDVGEDVWIGAHAVILPGVTVGNGAVIAAGSIVLQDVPAGSIVAGVPARIKKFSREAEGLRVNS